MAKDGTNRGVNGRMNGGRKPKPLADRIQDGTAEKKSKVLSFPDPYEYEGADIKGNDMPPVKEFMEREAQAIPFRLTASEFYKETYEWLQSKGCAHLVNSTMIEVFAMAAARWVQCEEMVSKYGFVGKHPTTGGGITSPYVTMSQNYMKQVNATWFAIYQIVKENCTTDYRGHNPHDDILEKLLMGD